MIPVSSSSSAKENIVETPRPQESDKLCKKGDKSAKLGDGLF